MSQTVPPPAGPGAARPRAQARFRLRITVGEAIAIGPGKVALLEAIADTGSITAGAKQLGMSYRRAWLLVDELNRALRQPALDSAKGGLQGGGSQLTDAGRQLITLYRQVEATAASACAAELKALVSLLRR